MQNLILTKTSSENEIRNYFKSVLKISKSNEEFPVNLDEVWPLVYGRKADAAEALRRDFIENVDYQILRRNPQNSDKGRPVDDYILTVSCMEFFIARKVRAVFNVYRQVFHRAVDQMKLQSTDASIIKAKLAVASWMFKELNFNENSKLKVIQAICEPLALPLPNYTPSQGQLLSASELLSRSGSPMTTQDFNKKMIEAGYIVVKERQSSKGKTKNFKSITPKGSTYGENQVCPNNPKETQPLYYADKFDRLLESLKL